MRCKSTLKASTECLLYNECLSLDLLIFCITFLMSKCKITTKQITTASTLNVSALQPRNNPSVWKGRWWREGLRGGVDNVNFLLFSCSIEISSRDWKNSCEKIRLLCSHWLTAAESFVLSSGPFAEEQSNRCCMVLSWEPPSVLQCDVAEMCSAELVPKHSSGFSSKDMRGAAESKCSTR